MSQRVTALLAIPLVLLAWFAGYRSASQTPSAPLPADGLLPVSTRPGAPVASFDGVAITDADLRAAIEEQAPFVRHRYATPEGRREFLDNLVRFELLAREAQKKGYTRDVEIVRQHKRNLVALFVQREFEEPQQKVQIPEPDLRAYYDSHAADYNRPERVRIAHVFWAAPADPEKRKAQRAAAEAALATVKEKDAKDYAAFGELARTASEDPGSKSMGGDLQFLSREALTTRAGAEVAAAAFELKEMGRVLEKVVETPQGFHALKLLGREAALDLPFEKVKDSIRGRLVYERRSESYKKFIEGVNTRAGLTVDAAALAAVSIDPGEANPEAARPAPPAPPAPAPPPPPKEK